MDGVALIKQAQAAGLRLSVVDGKLVIKGPRRLEALATLITNNKTSVLTALYGSPRQAFDANSGTLSSVGVTETTENTDKTERFADKGIANRRRGGRKVPLEIAPVPPEILADPIVLCPSCANRRVLRELRGMTGGLCYECWEMEMRS